MILCDPFAINTLSLSTIRHLQELVSQETLPRVSIVMAAGCAKRILSTCEIEFYSIGGYWHMGALWSHVPRVLALESREAALPSETRRWHGLCELSLMPLSSFRIVPTLSLIHI